MTTSDSVSPADRAGPLDGVRVVDLSSVIMGPLATQMLADQGADVIVVETLAGDPNRAMGPGPRPDLSGTSLNLMRNKRSLAIDLGAEAGRSVLRRLIDTADVFVTNLRPGSRRRLGVHADDLGRDDLVYCAAVGYRSDGPDAELPAYDDIVQSEIAMPELSERAGLGPAVSPTLIVDKTVGIVIAQRVAVALFERERTGRGTVIDIAMRDVMAGYQLVEHGAAGVPQPPLDAPGYGRLLTPFRRPQRTADGWIHVLPYERHQFESLFRLAGRPDLCDDERIVDRPARSAHAAELYELVLELMPTRTTADWLAVLRDANVPAAALGTIAALLDELPVAEHPVAGRYRVTPPLGGERVDVATIRRHAPLLGADGPEILAELGVGDAEVDAMLRAGVLGAPS